MVTKKIFFVRHFLQLTVKSCQFLSLTAIFEAVLRLSVYPIETPLIKKKKRKKKRKEETKTETTNLSSWAARVHLILIDSVANHCKGDCFLLVEEGLCF